MGGQLREAVAVLPGPLVSGLDGPGDGEQHLLCVVQILGEPPEVDEVAHPNLEFDEVERLREKVRRADLQPTEPRLSRVQTGEEHHRQQARLLVRLETPADLVAVDPRHHHVEQDDVGLTLAREVEAGLPVERLPHLETERVQRLPHRLQALGLVVDDQDGTGSSHARNSFYTKDEGRLGRSHRAARLVVRPR
jgi:hypothetical protein